jgi:hypothetical protein
MRKLIFTIVFIATTLFSYAQTIEGNWNGLLEVQGQKLTLVFHIENKEGKLISLMDSPDQKAFGIPVENTLFEANVLTMGLPNLKIIYKGIPNADFTEIEGTFSQSGNEFPLKLSKKAIEKTALIRPQTPKAPFSYTVEEVTFTNTADQVTLAGTLTLPNAKGKFPVVILITGSGQQDRDETIFEHKPFAVIADDLTKKGFAVLRYDDRGIGKSTGSFQNCTSADFANDVRAAIAYLKTRQDINPKKMGLLGHSEGGMIAPMVAADSKDIKFIVLMAGPGTPIDELLIEQSIRYSELAGADQESTAANAKMQKDIYSFIKNYKSDHLESDLTAYIQKEMAQFPADMKPQTEEELNQAVSAQVKTVTGNWFLYFLRYNPAENLSKLKCGVLALNGALDFQVPAKTNLKAIENALIKGNNKNFKIVELPGLNHLFQDATTGSFEEYSKIEQTISPKALSTISDWVLLQTK